MRRFEGRLRRLESRHPQRSCVDSPRFFLLAGSDFPEGRPPRHERCVRCGEFHGAFDGYGRRIILHEDESGVA
jgi:hypothetical protein